MRKYEQAAEVIRQTFKLGGAEVGQTVAVSNTDNTHSWSQIQVTGQDGASYLVKVSPVNPEARQLA